MLSQEQKTDIGNRFINEINRRIKTRKELQEKANAEYRDLQSSFEQKKKDHADELIKKHNITGKVKEFKISNYNGMFKILTDTIEFYVAIPEAVFKKYDTTEIVKTRSALCHEIEFLHALLGDVGGFQRYTSQLMCPKTKTEKILDTNLKPYIQSFIDLKRPVVCIL